MGDPAVESVSPERLAKLVQLMQADDPSTLSELEREAARHPGDARLHFLLGSLRASRQDYDGAISSLTRAVAADADFTIARFQLGLLLLTCGKPVNALETWRPLDDLPRSSAIHHFVTGLRHLVADEFEAAARALREGIARNRDNPPLNRDMAMIVAAIEAKSATDALGVEEEPVLSSAQSLLRQASIKPTRH